MTFDKQTFIREIGFLFVIVVFLDSWNNLFSGRLIGLFAGLCGILFVLLITFARNEDFK